MRVALLGSLLAAGLLVVVVALSIRTPVYAQPPAGLVAQPGAPSDQLIAFSSDVGQGSQQITLIDPRSRVMGVYHLDRATGQITLKSVRNVHWDLLMDEFNGVSPSPREIHSLLEQR